MDCPPDHLCFSHKSDVVPIVLFWGGGIDIDIQTGVTTSVILFSSASCLVYNHFPVSPAMEKWAVIYVYSASVFSPGSIPARHVCHVQDLRGGFTGRRGGPSLVAFVWLRMDGGGARLRVFGLQVRVCMCVCAVGGVVGD